MKVAHKNAAGDYLNRNYETIPLKNISINYQFFFSNLFEEGNAVSIIIKTKEEPKVITLNNFVLDSEIYEKFFSDKKLLEGFVDIFDNEDNQENENDESKNLKNSFKKSYKLWMKRIKIYILSILEIIFIAKII